MAGSDLRNENNHHLDTSLWQQHGWKVLGRQRHEIGVFGSDIILTTQNERLQLSLKTIVPMFTKSFNRSPFFVIITMIIDTLYPAGPVGSLSWVLCASPISLDPVTCIYRWWFVNIIFLTFLLFWMILPHMGSWTQWTQWDLQSVEPTGSKGGAWKKKRGCMEEEKNVWNKKMS